MHERTAAPFPTPKTREVGPRLSAELSVASLGGGPLKVQRVPSMTRLAMQWVTSRKLGVSLRRQRRGGGVFAAALGMSLAASPVWASPQDSMLELQIELAEMVEQDDVQSVSALRARVDEGLPPAALTAMLDACLEHPRAELEPLLRDLAAHRTSAIRARSLLAWAGLGPTESVDAIQAAADDRDAGVRRLAVVLARLYPSDRAEALVAQLLEHDPELAEEIEAQGLSAPDQPAQEGDAS